jgi:hypothetical protein
MLFLGEVAAALLLGVLGALIWTKNAKPTSVAQWIFVFATVFAYLFFWVHVWSVTDGFWSHRSTWKPLPRESGPAAGAVEENADLRVGFADWIRRRIKAGDSFYIVPANARAEPAVYQWFTYRLLPNVASERADSADWLIFYDTSPAHSGLSAQLDGAPEQYARNYSIGRTRHAS